MRTFGSVLVACVVLALPARGQDKKPAADAKKIVGTWEVVKSGSTPKGSTVEFTKDGRVKIRVLRPGADKPLAAEMAYKIKGDQLTFTLRGRDGEEEAVTLKVKKLTDKKLVYEDGEGNAEELKRK